VVENANLVIVVFQDGSEAKAKIIGSDPYSDLANVSAEKGAYVVRVVPGGPADQAGLQGGDNLVSVEGMDVPTGGDVILKADGETIDDYSELLSIIASHQPGDQVNFTILRNREERHVTATLGPRPSN